MTGGVGLTGKHPAFGDFIGWGLAAGVRGALDRWLETALPEVAATLGDAWAQVWDGSPGFGFWIGGEIWSESGGAAVCGWLCPSRDRVGRRWPLVVVVHPAPADPPPLWRAEGFDLVATAAACGRAALICQPETVAHLAEGLAPLAARVPPASAPVSGLLWAVNPALSPARLWADLAALDHRRAAQRSCYLWVDAAPGRASAAMASAGLPAGAGLAWLLAGVAGASAPAATATDPGADPDADPGADPAADPAAPNRSLDDVRH